MESCKYCQKTFKRVSAHINKCPARQEDSEVADMTPCRYCKKMFKRVSAHEYRCPENTERKTKKDSSEEELDDNKEATNMTPCRYCKKMFKRVSAHDYRCPENPERKTKKDPSEKVNGNKETTNMTPCRYCKKMFKRVAAHDYRCPENPESRTRKKSSSEEEVDVNEDITNMTPCRYCKKMFKRVYAHDYRCPENPERKTMEDPSSEEVNDMSGRKSRKDTLSKEEEEEDEEDEEEKEDEEEEEDDDELEEEDDCEEAINMSQCGYCKKRFGLDIVHYGNCPKESLKNIHKENVADNEINFVLTSSLSKPLKYTVTDKFSHQSENRSKFSAASPFSSNPVCPEHEKGGLPRPPIHDDYDLSCKQKKPARRFDPELDESIHDYSSRNSYESWEMKSGATASGLKRPPIHNVDNVSDSGRSEDTLLNSSGNSFYQASDSDDSFVYLNQDLKRPPIHKDMSPLMKNSDKKEEEFFDFQRHISRE